MQIQFFSIVFVAPGRQLQSLHELSGIVFDTIDCSPRINDIFNNYGYTWKHQIQQSSLNDFGINWINRFLLDFTSSVFRCSETFDFVLERRPARSTQIS